MNKHALLLTTDARTTKVARIKRELRQAEEELGLVKKQLEANKGKRNPVHMAFGG